MQYFYITKGSTLPVLRVELINDGNFEFLKSYTFNNAIQNADITFSMKNEDGILKISKAPCTIVLSDETSCTEKYFIEYKWKERDTKVPGHYHALFEIKFKDDLYESGQSYEKGNLRMPIYEELVIVVK